MAVVNETSNTLENSKKMYFCFSLFLAIEILKKLNRSKYFILTSLIIQIQTFSIMPEINCVCREHCIDLHSDICIAYALSLLECMTLSLQLCNNVTGFS